MADVKGDLAGITQAGSVSEKLAALQKERGIEAQPPAACPATLWDVFADEKSANGHPVRATVSDMGPLLLARMLDLNDIQQGVLQLVFKIADDNGLLLLDLKDLRTMLQHVGDNAAQFQTEYGNVSTASIGAIQRGLMQVGAQGGDRFFGEPMLDIADFMQTAPASGSGKAQGVINILAADKLLTNPRLYATFLLWMLSELFERLPEVGDLDKPKLVFFFDEAHLLFDDAPKFLLERIELVVRLVRSKGVGVYFVTQNPLDVPDSIHQPARQPRAARLARLHAARPESGEGGGEHDARDSQARDRDRDHRAGHGRGAGQPARREGPTERHRARLRHSAGEPHRPDQRRRAQGIDRRLALRRRLREDRRPRVGLREAEGPRRGVGRRAGHRRRRRSGNRRCARRVRPYRRHRPTLAAAFSAA